MARPEAAEARPAAGPAEPILAVEDLRVHYGAVAALNGVSLSVGPGEVVALLGANGAGKSTTLRAISGLLRPRGGAIRFAGQRIDGLPPARIVRLGIAHSPEGRRVFGSLTVGENLRLGAVSRSDPEGVAADRQRMFELFPILGMRMHQQAGTLSGGEQQMLALARAMMARPKLLMMDEPSLGIAPIVVQSIFRTLQELKGTGVAMLLVEQNISLALDLADRAYVLRTGAVSLSGTGAAAQGGLRQGRRRLSRGAAMSPSLYVGQQVINAISLGSLYALVAIGLSMVFGILRMANFAHGDMMMVGAFATLVLGAVGVPFWIAALGGVAAGALAGMVVERVAYRPGARGAGRDAAADQPRRHLHPGESRHPDLHQLAAEFSDPRLDEQRHPVLRRPDHLHADQRHDRAAHRRWRSPSSAGS